MKNTAPLLILSVMVAWLCHSCVILPAYTKNIKGKHAIAQLEKVELGGFKQSILIRSRDTSNPILLFLHGGPGMPMMFLSHNFQSGLEEEFIVVQHDRRGAGKSYKKNMDTSTISDEQYYHDALELIQYLKDRFGEEKIYLAGHSWGTYLGSILASQHPELFHAYISIGQVVNSQKARPLQRAFIEHMADSLNRQQALKDLETYGYGAHEKWLFKFGGEIHGDTSYQVFVKAGMRSPEYSMFDALRIGKASQFVSSNIKYKLISSTIEEDILSYDLPCYFIVGLYDMTTPHALIESYYESITAPKKALYWFEESAHFPFYEETERFTDLMTQIKGGTLP